MASRAPFAQRDPENFKTKVPNPRGRAPQSRREESPEVIEGGASRPRELE
jgi:hypothetical protein